MPNPLYRQNIISVADLSTEQLELLLHTALKLKAEPRDDLLEGKLIGSCFFEPSTRTRLSFETAVQRLGGKVIGFADGANTSAKKGETLADTARIISSYTDAIIQRHPKDGAARVLAEFSGVPVINAGDGTNQHPSQTLLDLVTITKPRARFPASKSPCAATSNTAAPCIRWRRRSNAGAANLPLCRRRAWPCPTTSPKSSTKPVAPIR